MSQEPGTMMQNYVMEKMEKKQSSVQDEEEKKENPVNILNDTWTMWYRPRGRNVQYQNDDYTSVQHNLGSFNTIEDFFSIYCYLKRPSEIEMDHKICCFRKNARPAWEDYPNGGSWILMFKKKDHTSLNYCWENLLLSLIGEQFNDYNVIGILISLRSKKNLIEIWIKDSEKSKKEKVCNRLCELLGLETNNINLYFKNHASSLAEASTLKNAENYEVKMTPYGETPMIPEREKVFDHKEIKELDEFEL
ncbi:Translation Initiation factor eIF- 4e-like domain [Pseudocohnilembus persalinus]|uniref:Translation Initiation factor eIF-4e-like domain n=1 Tax=Pseudocohnilembus persalinus TaxID=266149 RepID=A0A0V0QU26_PSEPJ|nr:Translation Initiation factor eIF- 4e-like domain [Pseudocohnilembus persalinus]|eukprot:KRX05718.1 Translation Initiation factor eIF- 4e-like domain [Pseudocohnilembus persalinus]